MRNEMEPRAMWKTRSNLPNKLEIHYFLFSAITATNLLFSVFFHVVQYSAVSIEIHHKIGIGRITPMWSVNFKRRDNINSIQFAVCVPYKKCYLSFFPFPIHRFVLSSLYPGITFNEPNRKIRAFNEKCDGADTRHRQQRETPPVSVFSHRYSVELIELEVLHVVGFVSFRAEFNIFGLFQLRAIQFRAEILQSIQIWCLSFNQCYFEPIPYWKRAAQ